MEIAIEKAGGLDVLNVGAGHIEFRFNKDDLIELERAKRCIQEMLRMGYAIFVEREDGKHAIVEKFDSSRGVYVIADVPKESNGDQSTTEISDTEVDLEPKKKRGRPPTKEIPMEEAKATAVGRSAGG
jgi:hypothetical protein